LSKQSKKTFTRKERNGRSGVGVKKTPQKKPFCAEETKKRNLSATIAKKNPLWWGNW